MKHWSLIAYDIREPKRLRRVHAYLRKQAQAVQYSVFILESDDARLNTILAGLRERADQRDDDIRLYAIPDPGAVWIAGTQAEKVAGLYAPVPSHPPARGVGQWLKGLFGRQAA
jgi:CRISPR-associated protein Cas2